MTNVFETFGTFAPPQEQSMTNVDIWSMTNVDIWSMTNVDTWSMTNVNLVNDRCRQSLNDKFKLNQ